MYGCDLQRRMMTRMFGDNFYYIQIVILLLALKIGGRKYSLCNEIHPKATLKEELLGPPDIYLRSKMGEVILENGIKAWSFSSVLYV